ncbi:MAG: hypothetical protein K2J39_02600, partial [Ruminococcus sp.]|nr:hypothetical protein [Ruminococcus sp.]
DIDRVEIENGEYLFGYSNHYIIDFKNNTFTDIETERDSEKEKTTHFSAELKEEFIHYANIYGMFSWEESYVNLNVDDGGYTEFLIVYTDGSQKEIWCDNAYPDTYDAMWNAFFKVFGIYMIWEGEQL